MNTSTLPSDVSAPLVLHYTVRSCPLGQVLVAATGNGVAAVLLGDDKASLVQELAQRYPQARLETGSAQLQHWSDLVLQALAQPAQAQMHTHALPLDVLQGTDFQRKVWAALCRIPGGQTCTYAQLAQALGQPKAVRAVASACAANSLAVIVPCHRVLRSDGGLGGYRWGLARKQQLLAQEAG